MNSLSLTELLVELYRRLNRRDPGPEFALAIQQLREDNGLDDEDQVPRWLREVFEAALARREVPYALFPEMGPDEGSFLIEAAELVPGWEHDDRGELVSMDFAAIGVGIVVSRKAMTRGSHSYSVRVTPAPPTAAPAPAPGGLSAVSLSLTELLVELYRRLNRRDPGPEFVEAIRQLREDYGLADEDRVPGWLREVFGAALARREFTNVLLPAISSDEGSFLIEAAELVPGWEHDDQGEWVNMNFPAIGVEIVVSREAMTPGCDSYSVRTTPISAG